MHMHSRRRPFYAAIAALAPALALSGCGGGGSSSGTGTLSVVMSDAPDPTITSLVVTIDRVEAHVDGQWTPITTNPATFNLLDLVHNEALLGSANLPAGHYTQVRFFPSAATVTDSAGTHTVTIPSGVQSGVKVNIDHDIEAGQTTTILLDFNVCKSLNKLGNGQYQLQPVIPAVVKILSGTVTGAVMDGSNPVAGAMITATYEAGSAYPVGTEVNTSASLPDGTFKVWALLPGPYTIKATFTDPATSVAKTATVTGVVVTANQNTDVGAMALQ
jgi:hypothetical protein